jgi:hypothetical protein
MSQRNTSRFCGAHRRTKRNVSQYQLMKALILLEAIVAASGRRSVANNIQR